MQQLVECVPNFSEGRDSAKINKITASIEAVPGITLLDVDPGADTNRTVVTFVGPIEAVEDEMNPAIKIPPNSEEFMDEFSKLGYQTNFQLLNSAEYGVPQIRNLIG